MMILLNILQDFHKYFLVHRICDNLYIGKENANMKYFEFLSCIIALLF